jgi:hypothetical protein
MESSDIFGPILRAEALRRGMAYAGRVVLLIDGASGLENLGLINFKVAAPSAAASCLLTPAP